MTRTIAIIAAMLLGALQIHAQDPMSRAEQILSRLDSCMVSLSYTCTVDSGSVPIEIEGKLTAQQDCYRAEGNGLVIICDGPTRWTVDPQAKEVYIEDAGGIREVLLYSDRLVRLEISDVDYMPLSADTSMFSLDCSSLGDEWVITDLRGE